MDSCRRVELEEGMMGIYFFGSRGADSTLFFEYLWIVSCSVSFNYSFEFKNCKVGLWKCKSNRIFFETSFGQEPRPAAEKHGVQLLIWPWKISCTFPTATLMLSPIKFNFPIEPTSTNHVVIAVLGHLTWILLSKSWLWREYLGGAAVGTTQMKNQIIEVQWVA